MKIVLSLCILSVLLSFPMQDKGLFRQLKQLEGGWKMQTEKRIIYEHWSITSESEMIGNSYAVKGKDTILLERVKLAQNGNNIFYVPVVEGQNRGRPVSFKLINADQMKFTFENKAHDYPQRIIYHIITKDSLHAWVEGTKNGKEMRSDYYFKRVN